MQQLPEQFKKYGHTYTQFKRGEHAFIYKATNEESVWFEVFKIKDTGKDKMVKFGGGAARLYPLQERYPGNESFGKWAWSLYTEEKALKFFNALEELKGDLKAFYEFRFPNPVMKVFELHKNGEAYSIQTPAGTFNKTVRVNEAEMDKAIAKAKEAFQNILGPTFDIRGWVPTFLREEFMFGKAEVEEVDVDEDEEDDDNE